MLGENGLSASTALRDVCVRKAEIAMKCLNQFAITEATPAKTEVPKGTGIGVTVS